MSRYRSTDRRRHVKELNGLDAKENSPCISPSLWALRIDKGSKKEESVAWRMKEKNQTQSECGTPARTKSFFHFNSMPLCVTIFIEIDCS
ncbi:hypothetical protein CEXT_783341 [Caerostris extrusa]|uniref:Uncharacterized protein n=1 Tax=Caerostris extrusa TaxID=172846 RepID=A0AAV4MT53_CAEEX|nr:hypothetical protein CEXT_783341 [Caerostris extrusa]